MLLLSFSSDILRITTSAAVTTDAYAVWEELNSPYSVPRRQGYLISTATDTTLVPSPSGTVPLIVRTLCIRNRHASTSQDVTVKLYDGTNNYELYKATLLAGECLQYQDNAGFWITDALGRPKTSDSLYSPAINQLTVVVLGSDQVNNNAVANTLEDVTGLSFNTVAGQVYWFRASIVYDAAATATGSRWTVYTTGGAPTAIRYRSEYSLTTTTVTINEGQAAVNLPAASNATSAATNSNFAKIEGLVTAGSNGTFQVAHASEVAASAITAKAGSILEWYRVL